jgi:CheY-like chemotaxis protein
MSKHRRIVWIDDEPNRARVAELLAENCGIPVCFENVKNRDLAGAVDKLLAGSQPSLVILDHILDQTATVNPLFRRGSTIAEAVKERWPSCPVIGVTNIDRLQVIDVRTKETYDDLFPLVNFSQYFERIDGIIKDFSKIAKTRIKSASDVVRFFSVHQTTSL